MICPKCGKEKSHKKMKRIVFLVLSMCLFAISFTFAVLAGIENQLNGFACYQAKGWALLGLFTFILSIFSLLPWIDASFISLAKPPDVEILEKAKSASAKSYGGRREEEK